MTDVRPENCRDRLKAEGKAYRVNSCEACRCFGGMIVCPHPSPAEEADAVRTEAPRPPPLYSSDEGRLNLARFMWERLFDAEDPTTIRDMAKARTQMIARIQVALREAYEQGQRMGAGRLDHPPMTLSLHWEKFPERERSVPIVRDDYGRRMPMVFAVNVNDEVGEVPEIHLGLRVDGEKVVLGKREGDDHG